MTTRLFESNLQGPVSNVAGTNLCKISVRSDLRIDEFVLLGSIDLACVYFETIKQRTNAEKLIFLPITDDKDRIRIIALVPSGTPNLRFTGGCLFDKTNIPIHAVQSHKNHCNCSVCFNAVSAIVRRLVAKKFESIGRSEYLNHPLLPLIPSSCGFPGMKMKALAEMPHRQGHMISIDSIVKYLGSSNLLESIMAAQTMDHLVGAIIASDYSGKIYKIKSIRYDMDPVNSCFFDKRKKRVVSFAEHVKTLYPHIVASMINEDSPLVEVYPENRSETCFVIPELFTVIRASSTGGGRRPTSPPMSIVHEKTRLVPLDRKACIDACIQDMGSLIKPSSCCLELKRVDVMGSVLQRTSSPRKMAKKLMGLSWVILTVGVLQAVQVEKLIPQLGMDSGPSFVGDLLEWKRRRGGQAAPTLAIIILKDRNMYSRLKFEFLVNMGISCQMIRFDRLVGIPVDWIGTLREQLNDKLSSWSDDGVYVVDFHRFGNLSILTACRGTHIRYHLRIMRAEERDIAPEEMAQRYGELISSLRDHHVADDESSIVVMYASRRRIPVGEYDSDLLERIRMELDRVFPPERVVFLSCTFRTDCRLFSRDGNVEPGFVFDCPVDGKGAFFMVPHSAPDGNALPIHCLVVKNGPRIDGDWIKEYVLGLCEGGRIPKPFVHTLRLSELIGIHLKRVAGDCRQLCRDLARSRCWQNLCLSGKPFYL